MANAPWAMKQEWHHVVFLHWPVSAESLRDKIPEELEIDEFNGTAWIGLVLFKAEKTRVRFTPPIPTVESYNELNVRTYVKYKGRTGVYFFSLDADSFLAVKAAGTGGFLPYRHADMEYDQHKGQWEFTSNRTHKGSFPESLHLKFRVVSKPIQSNPFEQWLTERYCLWTKPQKNLLRVDISHIPWNLHYVEGEIGVNTMANFLAKDLHQEKAISHYAKPVKVLFYPPVIEK